MLAITTIIFSGESTQSLSFRFNMIAKFPPKDKASEITIVLCASSYPSKVCVLSDNIARP